MVEHLQYERHHSRPNRGTHVSRRSPGVSAEKSGCLPVRARPAAEIGVFSSSPVADIFLVGRPGKAASVFLGSVAIVVCFCGVDIVGRFFVRRWVSCRLL